MREEEILKKLSGPLGDTEITHFCLKAARKQPQQRLTPCFLETDDVHSAHCGHLYDGFYASVKSGDLAIQKARIRTYALLSVETICRAHPHERGTTPRLGSCKRMRRVGRF